MNKIYAGLILIIGVFLLAKLLPENTNKFSYKKPAIIPTKATSTNKNIAIPVLNKGIKETKIPALLAPIIDIAPVQQE